MFKVDTMIEPYTERLVEVLLEQIKVDDLNTKKIAIDAIYALTAIAKDLMVPHRFTIL